MSIIYGLVLVSHLIGMAWLVGSYLVTVTSGGPPRVLLGMQRGAEIAFLAGLVLVGLRASGAYDHPDGDVDNVRIAVKLAVAVVVIGLASRYRGAQSQPAGVVHAIGALAVLNVLVAVLWT